jgi:hypothetical protein
MRLCFRKNDLHIGLMKHLLVDGRNHVLAIGKDTSRLLVQFLYGLHPGYGYARSRRAHSGSSPLALSAVTYPRNLEQIRGCWDVLDQLRALFDRRSLADPEVGPHLRSPRLAQAFCEGNGDGC